MGLQELGELPVSIQGQSNSLKVNLQLANTSMVEA